MLFNADYGEVEPLIGERVEIHPRFDLWMMGAQYGSVTSVKGDIIKVRLDKYKKRLFAGKIDDVRVDRRVER